MSLPAAGLSRGITIFMTCSWVQQWLSKTLDQRSGEVLDTSLCVAAMPSTAERPGHLLQKCCRTGYKALGEWQMLSCPAAALESSVRGPQGTL